MSEKILRGDEVDTEAITLARDNGDLYPGDGKDACIDKDILTHTQNHSRSFLKLGLTSDLEGTSEIISRPHL